MMLEVFSNPASFAVEYWSWLWNGLTVAENITIWTVTTFLAASLAFLCYSRFIKKPRTKVPPLPPGPRGLPLVGNLLSVETDFHCYSAKLSKIYGPIFKLQLGRKICIVMSSASLAKQVLKDHDSIFANHEPLAAGLAAVFGGADIVFCPNSTGWQKLRKVFVQQVMTKASLDACYTLRRQEVHTMVKEIYKKVGSPINIGDQMSITIQNIVLTMLWGDALHGGNKKGIDAELRLVVAGIVELVGKPNISDLFPVLAKLDLQRIVWKINRLVKWLDRIFDSVIAHRNQLHQAKSKDLLQVLLELHKKNGDSTSFSMTELKALLVDIIVAGTDTSSTTLEWAMAEILKHPYVMANIYKELEKVVGKDKNVEESHLPELVYLGAVIKETFRLHPVVPLLVPRTPSESCTIGGYTIPKGSRVVFNAWQMHRDPEVWDDPMKFEPERFLEKLGKGDYHGNNFNFIPFGSGRRVCAGIPLAERMITYTLATLLHSFEWKLQEGTEVDFSEKFGIVLKKEMPLIGIPTARLSTAEQYI